jgi:glyoxylase-like metal-dependent hydrolase (beta-lactamase superfamily II)
MRTIAAALIIFALALTQPVPAQQPAPPGPQPLAAGVWLLPGRFERGRQPDGNSLLLQGLGGLVIIDSGRHAEHTQVLINAVRERGQPLVAVLNTHWHLDHLGGNAMLREAWPALRAFGTPAVRDAVQRRMPASAADLEKMKADPQLDADTRRIVDIDLALYAQRGALAPDVLIEGGAQPLAPAGRALRVGVEHGVSGGDLWVLDEASGTLAVGDFVTLPVPFFDTACPERWQRSLARLGALPFERVVPGHGPVMSRDDFHRYRGAFDRLLACAASDKAVAACTEGWAEDLGPLLQPGSQRVVQGMLKYYLEQRLRAPAEKTAADCAAG